MTETVNNTVVVSLPNQHCQVMGSTGMQAEAPKACMMPCKVALLLMHVAVQHICLG